MLRAWEVQEPGLGRTVVRRYSVKRIGAGAWQHFADLKHLIDYLQTEFGDAEPEARREDEKR